MVYLLWGLVRSDAGAGRPARRRPPRRDSDAGIGPGPAADGERVARPAGRRAIDRAAAAATPMLFPVAGPTRVPTSPPAVLRSVEERLERPDEQPGNESTGGRTRAPRPTATVMASPAPPRGRGRRGDGTAPPARLSRREQYEILRERMLELHGIRVRRWRTNSSGVAWETHRRDGTVNRWIEAPMPRGPMSCAIFLHEVGHHAIGFHRYAPRCLEEYHAWRWALETMEAEGFDVTDAVRARVQESLEYAVAKAMRRGIRRLPEELLPYLPRQRGA